MAKILSGTDRDTWIFPDLQTIAINYPGLPEKIQDELFSSSSFFFDYETASKEEYSKLLWKYGMANRYGIEYIDKYKFPDRDFGRYQPSTNDGKLRLREFKEGKDDAVGLLWKEYVLSYKWWLMFQAWKQRLTATGEKPDLEILTPYYYRIYEQIRKGRGGTILDQMTVRSGTKITIQLGGSSDSWREWRGWNDEYEGMSDYERMNLLHPLVHFPPMEHTTILRDVPLVDPNLDVYARQERIEQMRKWYGLEKALYILNIAEERGITYGDLIKPDGYNFLIHFDALFLPADFTQYGEFGTYWIPFTRMAFTRNFLFNNLIHTEYHPDGSDRNNEIVYHIDPFYWPPPQIAAKRVLEARDNWILGWYCGGEISSTLAGRLLDSGRINTGYVRNSPLQLYGQKPRNPKRIPYNLWGPVPYDLLPAGKPTKIEEEGIDIWDVFQEIITVAVSVTVAVATGNIAPLIKTASKVVALSLAKAIPDIATYTNLAIPMITAGLMKEYNVKTPEGLSKAAKTITSLADPIAMGWTQNMIDLFDQDNRQMILQMDASLTDKQKDILAAINEKLAPLMLKVIHAVREIPASRSYVVALKVVKKQETSNALTLGAAVVGGALLLKWLKGK